MLIPLLPVKEKFKMDIRGVVHVGAHWGQEYEAYKQCGASDIIFIEPCEKAFRRLESLFGKMEDVKLMQCACGSADANAEMFVEENNQGQSNSLLQPVRHLTYYPQIQFPLREMVPVRKLDNLVFHRANYNFLMMDTQGSELMVLRGAVNTLPFIDYIYTEVNDQELYAGNALITELDAFLPDFKRVETFMVDNKGWGDAVYIRSSLLEKLNP